MLGQTVTEQAETKLSAIADASNREISNFFDSVKSDVVSAASSTTTIDAVKQFAGQCHRREISAGRRHIRRHFEHQQPLLQQASRALPPGCLAQMEQQGYYDIQILDPKGNLVNSLSKGADFTGNVAEGGIWAETGPCEVFRMAITLERGNVAFSGFAAYAPSEARWPTSWAPRCSMTWAA